MTRWLVLGSAGQLGSDLQRVLAGEDVTALDVPDVDITSTASVADVVPGHDVVVNAAAFTAVDAAETAEATAFLVNAVGPAYLAAECARTGARLIHVSTDYVFAGDGAEPYPEDAPMAPRSAYGRTKAAGEWAVRADHPAGAYVVRTAWVYGETGQNFVKTMLRLERERETVSVVDDQRGSPTWSLHLAQSLVALARSAAEPGTYHCTGSGDTTWFGFTRAIFEAAGADPDRVLPTTTDAFPRPAPRPAYSVLSAAKWRAAGLPAMPGWREALGEAMARAGTAFRGA